MSEEELKIDSAESTVDEAAIEQPDLSQEPEVVQKAREVRDRAVARMTELHGAPGSHFDEGLHLEAALEEASKTIGNHEAIGRKIEKEDIRAIWPGNGGTSIVFQRHGKYERDRDAETAGSITPESARELFEHDKGEIAELLRWTTSEPFFLFVSSDTQYAGKGFRSMETGQVAQDAAVAALIEAGFDPEENIINFNPTFKTARHEESGSDIRPMPGIREPQIFNPRDVAYITYLQEKYGYADEEAKAGLSVGAWAAHEMDAEAEMRQTTGAEGENEMLARTKKSLAILERYAKIWHANNPGKQLIIWATSHYDTISPLVKEVDGVLREEDGLSDAYQAVDYGGGVVIKIPSAEEGKWGNTERLTRRGSSKPIELGDEAAKIQLEGQDINSVTRLDQPNY